jgi:hypothetical protein
MRFRLAILAAATAACQPRATHGARMVGEFPDQAASREVQSMDKKAKTPKKPKQIKPKGSGTAK